MIYFKTEESRGFKPRANSLKNFGVSRKRNREPRAEPVGIYIFHGENQPALRDALLELKKRYDEAVFWEKDPEELSMYLASPTLLSQKGLPADRRELVIIEDPSLTELPNLMELIKTGGKDVALVFSDKIPLGVLPKDTKVRTIYFREEIPKNVFPFLDALAAKDRKKAFVQAHRLLRAGEDIHFLLTMIVWQMRSLAMVKGKATKGLHPYVLGKLRRLEGNFTEGELSEAFSLLLKEELNLKKGRANSVTLDFLIEKLVA